jgi:hypothetical protein
MNPFKPAQSGWLSPEGVFHPVQRHFHTKSILEISGLDERKAELIGWLKLVDNGWLRDNESRKVTQAQLDTMWDLMNKESIFFPQWASYKMEDMKERSRRK